MSPTMPGWPLAPRPWRMAHEVSRLLDPHGSMYLRTTHHAVRAAMCRSVHGLCVRSMSERPDEGAHGAFLEEIIGVADEMKVFPEENHDQRPGRMASTALAVRGLLDDEL